MIVDDDPMFNMINKRIMRLSKFGEEIDAYLNGSDALLNLKAIMKTDVTKFPDVMFIDINMPLMDGWQFLDELNKFPEMVMEKCKIYMLTSSIDQNDFEKAMGYKIVSTLISKPLTTDRLEIIKGEVPILELECN